VLDLHLRSLGATTGPSYSYDVLTYTGHKWALLEETTTCDWLATRTWVTPTSGNLIADRDAKYFHFQVVQDQAGAFTPFQWQVDAASNLLRVHGTSNLARVTLDLAEAGLAPAQSLTVDLGTLDGLADEVRLANYGSIPTAVLRDGLSETSWSHIAGTSELRLVEYDGGAHQWQIVP
jgi:hypothetical protein